MTERFWCWTNRPAGLALSLILGAGIFMADFGLEDVQADVKSAPGDALEVLKENAGSTDLGQEGVTLQTMPFFLDKEVKKAAGQLLPATRLHIKLREGDWLLATVEGWQQAGQGSVIYGAKGQRILTAIMAKPTIEHATTGEPEVEEITGQTWMPVALDIWLPVKNVTGDIAPVWQYASSLYQNDCASCHTAHSPGHFTANQWIGQLKSMERFSQLDKEQNRLVLKFLQYHAKDGVNASGH